MTLKDLPKKEKYKLFFPIIFFLFIFLMTGYYVGLITTCGKNNTEKNREVICKCVIERKEKKYPPPCKLSVWVQRDDGRETKGIPNFSEYLLDGAFCESLGEEKSQTTYGFENGEVFLELYKLPWTVSDNFDGENNNNKPKETFNLEEYN